jgi:hypothetical protein
LQTNGRGLRRHRVPAVGSLRADADGHIGRIAVDHLQSFILVGTEQRILGRGAGAHP